MGQRRAHTGIYFMHSSALVHLKNATALYSFVYTNRCTFLTSIKKVLEYLGLKVITLKVISILSFFN